MNSTASVQAKEQASTATATDKPKQKARPNANNKKKRAGKSQAASNAGGNGQRRTHEPRKGSFPYTVEHFMLNHKVMLGAYNRYFDRYRWSFYHVTAVLQKLELEEGLELVHEYVSSQLDDAERAISSAKAKALAVLEAHTGSKHYRIMSPDPAKVEAKIPSFLVRRFMNLFKQVDDYIDLVVFAEGMGAISFMERQKTLKNSPRYLTKIAGRFQSVATQLSEEELRKQQNAWEVLQEIVRVAENLKPIGEGRPLALQKPKKKKTAAPGNRRSNGQKSNKTAKANTTGTEAGHQKQAKTVPAKKKAAAKKAPTKKANGTAADTGAGEVDTGTAADWGVS